MLLNNSHLWVHKQTALGMQHQENSSRGTCLPPFTRNRENYRIYPVSLRALIQLSPFSLNNSELSFKNLYFKPTHPSGRAQSPSQPVPAWPLQQPPSWPPHLKAWPCSPSSPAYHSQNEPSQTQTCIPPLLAEHSPLKMETRSSSASLAWPSRFFKIFS